MIVKLILPTRSDPGATVIVEANIRFTEIQSFDNWLKAQKLARDWLKRELDKG